LLRGKCGRYNAEGVKPSAFLGWAHILNISGLAAVDIGWNAVRVARTAQDVRLDSMEHFFALFQISGKAAMTQNDRPCCSPRAMSCWSTLPGPRPISIPTAARDD
jgi:AraC family transcriptional activator of tynA and feaB